jgi:hypothetical protein
MHQSPSIDPILRSRTKFARVYQSARYLRRRAGRELA